MLFPTSMPDELHRFMQASSQEDLFKQLVESPAELLQFFTLAAADEFWAAHNLAMMKMLVDWMIQQAINDKLSMEYRLIAAETIRSHLRVLGAIIPEDITVVLKDAHIHVNSLLISVASEYFHILVLNANRYRKDKIILLQNVTESDFLPFYEYFNKGAAPTAERMGSRELLRLLHQAISWGVKEMSEQCQKELKKYIDATNIEEMFQLSKKHDLPYLRQACIDFINASNRGFQLASDSHEHLSIQFSDFTERTINNFSFYAPYVTHLICHDANIKDHGFGSVLKQCVSLNQLDISNTPTNSEYLGTIPTIEALDVSQCVWLSTEVLKLFASFFHDLKKLALRSNVQLNYGAWGELISFPKLKELDLSHCSQLKDEDLRIIFSACPGLMVLSLEGCRRLTDSVFFELTRALPHLVSLNTAHCELTDSAAVEIGVRCRSLLSLNLSRCGRITEKGVSALAKQVPHLILD